MGKRVPVMAEFDDSDNFTQFVTPDGLRAFVGQDDVGVLRNAVVCVSDSTGMDGFSTAGPQTFFTDNIAFWAAAYSNQALSLSTSCSVGGWTTDDVDQYWDQRIMALKPRFPVLAIGLNNIYGASDATVDAADKALRAWTIKRVNQVLAYGGVPVIQTIFPTGSTYFAASAAKRKQHFKHNTWRRQYAAARGLPCLDVETMVIDPTLANGDPFAALFQPNGSPHPGKEVIRFLGSKLWDLIKPYMPAPAMGWQATRYNSDKVFSNPALTGVGGNINGGLGTLPDSVWGWDSGATGNHTTYAIEASADAKMDYTGAAVKSNWVKVTTNVGALPQAGAGQVGSSARPGLLFFSSGLTFSAGDIINAMAEIEIVTPNTIIGFTATLQDNSGTYGFTCPNQGSAFTPANNADNAKNEIKKPTVFTLPVIPMTIGSDVANAGAWLIIQPTFSGVAGAAGNAVWRVRNPDVWKAEAMVW